MKHDTGSVMQVANNCDQEYKYARRTAQLDVFIMMEHANNKSSPVHCHVWG